MAEDGVQETKDQSQKTEKKIGQAKAKPRKTRDTKDREIEAEEPKSTVTSGRDIERTPSPDTSHS
jgi:hypothetical protein